MITPQFIQEDVNVFANYYGGAGLLAQNANKKKWRPDYGFHWLIDLFVVRVLVVNAGSFGLAVFLNPDTRATISDESNLVLLEERTAIATPGDNIVICGPSPNGAKDKLWLPYPNGIVVKTTGALPAGTLWSLKMRFDEARVDHQFCYPH